MKFLQTYKIFETNNETNKLKIKEGDIAKFLPMKGRKLFYVKILRITPTSPYPYFVEIIDELNDTPYPSQKLTVAKESQIVELTPEEKEMVELHFFKTKFNL